MEVSLNYCSQNGGNLYRAPYYNGNPNIGPGIIGNLDQSPYHCWEFGARIKHLQAFYGKGSCFWLWSDVRTKYGP